MRHAIFITMLVHVAFTGSRVALSLYAIHLHASAFVVGSLMALYAFLPALLSISVGRLTDRIGVHRPMIFGALLVTVGALAPVAWTSRLAALYCAAAAIGVGFMVISVSVYQVIGELSPAADRPANFSLLSLAFSIGGLGGPMLAGFAIDAAGHGRAFAMLAAIAFTAAVMLMFVPVHLPRPHGHAERPSNAAVLDLLGNHELRRIYLAVALFSVAWDVFNFAVPLYGSRIGFSASQIGLVMGSFAAATFTVRLAMPWIARRWKPWRLLTISSALAGASYFLVPLSDNFLILVLLLFLLGLGLGAPQPMVLSLLHEAAPPGRGGEAVGVRILLINMSQTLMPLLFGALGAVLGMLPVFWCTAVCLGAGGWLARRRSAVEAPVAGG